MATSAQLTPPPIPSAPRRTRSLRAFLRPYRGTLTLASGLTLVETLLDLARPWPLKLAVDNAIGGRPLGWSGWRR
jgi:ATP-binding cassette, subfamily B, bacterial